MGAKKKVEQKQESKVVRGVTEATVTSKPDIKALADVVEFHGNGPCIAYSPKGHGGPGYYCWTSEYLDEGASFLTADTTVLCLIMGEVAQRLCDARSDLDEQVAKAGA